MILDTLAVAGRYSALGRHLATALAFLQRGDLAQLTDGRYEVDGDRVYAMVMRAPGKGPNGAKLEAHRKYIDIHYTVAGCEVIGWRHVGDCHEAEPYETGRDVQFFADAPVSVVAVPAGAYAITFVEDAHAPMMGTGEVHKVVMKVAVD